MQCGQQISLRCFLNLIGVGESLITKTVQKLSQCPLKIKTGSSPALLPQQLDAGSHRSDRSLQEPGYVRATCCPKLLGCFYEASAQLLLLSVLFTFF